jgi:hypothetical protein
MKENFDGFEKKYSILWEDNNVSPKRSTKAQKPNVHLKIAAEFSFADMKSPQLGFSKFISVYGERV